MQNFFSNFVPGSAPICTKLSPGFFVQFRRPNQNRNPIFSVIIQGPKAKPYNTVFFFLTGTFITLMVQSLIYHRVLYLTKIAPYPKEEQFGSRAKMHRVCVIVFSPDD